MFTKQIPPFVLGEVEWADSPDLVFHIPVQLVPDTPTNIARNTGTYLTIKPAVSSLQLNGVTGRYEVKLSTAVLGLNYTVLDYVNTTLDVLLYDPISKAGKWIDFWNCGSNYLGKNMLFLCRTDTPVADFICFKSPRTSSTNPSIEQVAAYLQFTPGDIITFDGQKFTFGGETIRF